VLSGHTDVVPVEGQSWSRDPFTLHIEDGRAYGRGAVDMKGFIALALALVPDFLAADLKTPIHLFFSYDEEVTCLGVVDGIARMGKDLPRPRAVIVGEPTSLELADAHKGIRTFFTTITGFAAHSSKPHLGASAVHAGVRLAAGLVGIADEREGRARPERPLRSALRHRPCRQIPWRHRPQHPGRSLRSVLGGAHLAGLDPEDVPARFAALRTRCWPGCARPRRRRPSRP
jgi:acetylornithine deacetylase